MWSPFVTPYIHIARGGICGEVIKGLYVDVWQNTNIYTVTWANIARRLQLSAQDKEFPDHTDVVF